MSDAPGVQLPLFPLNVVLFPGMLLPLHIFEPRYNSMIHRCLQEEGRFGVVLIAEGQPEDAEAAEPKRIGTVAKIVQIHHLAKDRMNIWVQGGERFEVLNYERSAAEYLLGRVSLLPERAVDAVALTDRHQTLRRKIETYLELLLSLAETDTQLQNIVLADDADRLSYQVASILDITLAEKQTLLETGSVVERIEQELAILHREIAYLHTLSQNQNKALTQELPWGNTINLN